MLLAYSWVFRLCCYAFSFLLGQSGERLILFSWPRHALDATLLASYWNFQHALGVFYSLNSRGLSDTFSLLCPGTCQHALDATLLVLLGALFFCFFLWRIKLQHALDATLLALSWTSLAHSWCYVLGSGSDTLLMLRAEPSLGTVPDALDATVHHNCDNTLLTFSWNFHSALVGATLRLLTLRSGDSHALGATLLALFWTTQARTL